MRVCSGPGIAAVVCMVAGYALSGYYHGQRSWREDLAIRSLLLEERKEPLVELGEAVGLGGREPVVFVDEAERLGLEFIYYDGAIGNYHIMETTGGGAAVLDYDCDGWQEVFFVNGCVLPARNATGRHRCKLFRSHGPIGFEDVSAVAGADLVLYGQGAAAADYNNDGFSDILITSYRRTVLLENMGDGTFMDVSERAGVSNTRWSTSAAFGDLDLDGDLDFYAACYAIVSAEKPRLCQKGTVRMHCLPQVFPSEPDLLYRNLGDGRFEECSLAAGINDDRGRGLGLAIADFDRDGLPDIFVSNDTTENYLFMNKGGFKFKEEAVVCGAALTGEGSTMSGMGVTCADYDGNLYFDIFVCNFYEEKNVLFQNMDGEGFVDNSDALGLAHTSRDKLTFGCAFLDADLDGYPDLFLTNGHVSDLTALGIPYRMNPQMYRNIKGQRFVDQSSLAGTYFLGRFVGRGAAVADWNNDGLPDLVVSNIRDRAGVLLNTTKPHGHWIGFKLTGRQSNRTALNTKIEVEATGRRLYTELCGGGVYLSSSDQRLLVGLGEATEVKRVRVFWPSGHIQVLERPQIDRYISIVEPLQAPPAPEQSTSARQDRAG